MQINTAIRVYQPSRQLCVFEGMRNVLPADAYPSFEVEPSNTANEWMTCRAQRPRYNFRCTLTVLNDNEQYGVEYISMIATMLGAIITDPQNLQMRILNETKWSPGGGLYDTYILDSLIDDITYTSFHEGSIRVSEFTWFATVHEPYPDSKFKGGDFTLPTVLMPRIAA